MKPGIHDGIPSLLYHADIGDTPTLSASVAKVLIGQSPAHARECHPKLRTYEPEPADPKFDLGTACHALMLEGIENVCVVPYDDWRTAAAKEIRDQARADGMTPLLAKQWDEVQVMAAAVRAQCNTHAEGPFFTEGTAESTLVWEDDYGVLCRARLDWLRDDRSACHDLKTTKASASPDAWSRTALSIGADLQAAWYGRGMRAVLGCEPDFRFVVAETTPPYAISVFAVAPDTLALAEKKVDYALKTWATCLRDDAWPTYTQRVAHIQTPPWVEAAWLERELREVAS